MSQQRLIFVVSLFLLVFGNAAFYTHLINVYPLNYGNSGFLLSLLVVLLSSTVLIFTLASSRFTTKPVLIMMLILAALAAYFMDSYGIVIDTTMIQNIIQTDMQEASGLFSLRLVLYLVFMGMLPAFLVYKTRISYSTLWHETLRKFTTVVICVVTSFTMIALFSDSYASFVREHKPLRYYVNPTYFIYSGGEYITQAINTNEDKQLRKLGVDASIPDSDPDRELVIMVVGETARANRFSINGYDRLTNPLLKQEDVISFSHFSSCGTTTAISVPCMFSIYTHNNYNDDALYTENALDILNHADVGILWRDNNSGSKGVATRVPHENFSSPDINPECNTECRDTGMLAGLQGYIDSAETKDVLIVLHQMGNHGPEYYKRYPESFEKFTPVCKSSDLNTCTREEINNAYDNAILYTDYFLSQVIDLLKNNSSRFETAMFYVSDHGESLGEYGLYLHGMPYVIAPQEQTHIPAILWFGDSFRVNTENILDNRDKHYSHDNIFHTLLTLFEIESDTYSPDKSLLGLTG